ncbi:molecular chaperone Hsp33 [Babesia caballi]|uniref:Molecular chaperone Hsp33 n=1 Tax=Babesia caballi TaxID=5871 RepID=A0AAV4LQ32_BABCB|nr:molecular chaperone Hsp33 [Babesia caballi]
MVVAVTYVAVVADADAGLDIPDAHAVEGASDEVESLGAPCDGAPARQQERVLEVPERHDCDVAHFARHEQPRSGPAGDEPEGGVLEEVRLEGGALRVVPESDVFVAGDGDERRGVLEGPLHEVGDAGDRRGVAQVEGPLVVVEEQPAV